MHLSFMRVDQGSSLDQPYLFDFLRYPYNTIRFAAVLGDPVKHSQTPAEQGDYFSSHNMGVVAVRMDESECHSLNLSILERLGMAAAAVTSPLKTKMRELCVTVDKKADELESVNTIVAFKGGWHGANTDVYGLQQVLKSFDFPNEIVVWGGGGTRMAMKQLLPHAHFFSARLGKEIWVEKQASLSPEVVVWALGRARQEQTKTPPEHWRPEYVIDLNYTEDSPGLEYAQKIGARYISGKAFFKGQARQQRQFWSDAKL